MSMSPGLKAEKTRIAILVDCDNVSPAILDYALQVAAPLGRIVLRRGYGNHTTLANRWQLALVRLAFTPCLQYQYATGKNTADIALALDAQEALFDGRADTFCLVTSDSDFSYLSRKLRERGATVFIVGETKSPDALRNAADQFIEWAKPVELHSGSAVKRKPKRHPHSVVAAVMRLAGETAEGRVNLGPLGQYLRQTDPMFSPRDFGHSGLLKMLRSYDRLAVAEEAAWRWTVRLASAVSPQAGTHTPV